MLSDAPAVAGLPWELLYDRRRGSFVALSEKTPVVRYLEVPDPPQPLAVNGSLKILVVVSSPTDLPELDVDGEWRRFKDALAPKIADGTVQLDRLPSPTIAALSKWLRGNHVHVLHFIGHGGYDRDIEDGVLFFTDRYSRRSQVAPNVLGPFLHDHDPLRLVVLNACHSARVDSTDPFSGMAQGLVQQDCTAVVAMQFPISDSAAAEFTGDFYGALADGLPVDQAVTSGRKALLADYVDEWATPVLFLRSPDGRVFDAISSPSVPTYRSGSAESEGDALPALTVATGGEAEPKGDGTEDVVPSTPAPPPAEPKGDGTEDVVPSTPAPPPAEQKRTGFGKRFVVVGMIVAALIVAAVGVVRWRSSTEDAQTPQPQTVPTTPSTGTSATSTGAPTVPAPSTINVPGAQAWTDAGLSCEPGLILEIAATGTVLYNGKDPAFAVGPDGSTDPSYREHNVAGLPDANHAALIGRLDQAQPFVVGAFKTYPCAGGGRLLLGINDKGLVSNSGAFIATIVPTTPSTASSTMSTGAPAVPAARTINVPATQNWTETGLSCEPGLILDITATGTVLHDVNHPELPVGPDGSTNPSYHRYNVDELRDSNHAALIGRLDQARPFVVGSSRSYPCAERGRFFLGVNDKGKGVENNSRAFIATITPRR
jgi:hypothetical protein